MKGAKDRIHELLDAEPLNGSPLDPASPEGETLEHYRQALEQLRESGTEAPGDFCDRVMASLPEPSRRSWFKSALGRFTMRPRWAVPALSGALAAGVLLLVVYSSEILDLPFYENKPLARADAYTVKPGGMLQTSPAEGVLANDTDPDTEHGLLKAHLVCPPSHCTKFTLNPDGSFTYQHDGVPEEDDEFLYRPFDGEKYGELVVVSFVVP
jgi:hypothetical protein